MRDDQETRERRRLTTLVHIGAAKLRMDDDTRKAMQIAVTRCDSCSDMSLAQLREVIAALNERGAGLRVWSRQDQKNGSDRSRLLWKIEKLTKAGSYTYPEYPMGISRSMYSDKAPAKLEWHTPNQLKAIVAALSYNAKRKSQRPSDAS